MSAPTLWEEYREQIRDAWPMPDLVDQTVTLPHSPNGRKPVMVRCPFHDDSTPSLAVYPDHAYCFGACRRSWDIFAWVMQRDALPFAEARDWLARERGISRPNWTPTDEREAEERRAIEDVLGLAADYYAEQLWDTSGAEALAYARSRVLTDDTIREARLGYANGGLAVHLHKVGVDLNVAKRAGLIREDGRDFFHNRLVFPHLRRGGRVIYLSARALSDAEPKYLNLPGPMQVYYNALALAHHATTGPVVIVEGQADALTLSQSGIAAIALCGTNLAERDVANARKYESVHVWLDNDDAGEKATAAIANMLGPMTRVISPLDGVDDPNTWAISGALPDDFTRLVADAPTWLDRMISSAATRDPDNRADALREVFALAIQLDSFALFDAKARICETLSITKGEFDTLLKRAQSEAKRRSKETGASPAFPRPASKRYVIAEGVICSVEFGRGGDEYHRPLCNFSARIVEDVARDDGQDVTRRFVITGKLDNGTTLPAREVEGSAFAAMNWVLAKWGVRAIVYAGLSISDRLREAIQSLSLDASMRHVFVHTGWREINGRRVYLTNGGALGLPHVDVELDATLARYRLPTEVTEVTAREGMAASLRMLDVGPLSVTLAVWAAMYVAPLTPFIPVDFSIFLYGLTGSLKSTLLALVLSHYGDFPDKTALPATWESTDNALEKLAFLVKDAPIVIDDYAPQVSSSAAHDLARKAARLFRAAGNRSGRDRMRSDTSLRPAYRPRGLIIATGEQLPTGQSLMARLLAVEMARDTINLTRLSEAQADARLYPNAMAGYLLWIMQQWDELQNTLPAAWREIRARMAGSASHLRIPEMFASIYLGADMAFSYAVEVGAITAERAAQLRTAAETALVALAEAQSGRVQGEQPTLRFLSILADLFEQKKIYLKPEDENDKGALGWIPRTSEDSGTIWEPSGEFLGWADADYLYLLSEAAYNRVAKFCRDEGTHFPVTANTLHKMLVENGYLVPGKDGRNTTSLKREGRARRVLKLIREQIGL